MVATLERSEIKRAPLNIIESNVNKFLELNNNISFFNPLVSNQVVSVSTYAPSKYKIKFKSILIFL